MAYSARAGAQATAPIDLQWTALEGCPTAASVLARVRKIAGATRATANTLRAEATVTQPSDGLFRLRLEIRYGNLAAVRNIEGKSCKDLAGAAAVALALLLSSDEPLSERDLAGTSPATTGSGTSGAVGTSGPPAGTPEPDKAAAPNPASQPPTQPPTQPTPVPAPPSVDSGPPRRWHVLLLAPLGSLGFGPMTQVSRGLGAGAGFSFDRWRFAAEGKLWASQHETISHVGQAYDVELNRFSATARGCRAVLGASIELAPCAVVSVHHLSARGSGPNFVSSGTSTVTWAAVGIGAQTRLLITPWLGVLAAVDGELQLSRPEVGASPPPESQLPISDQVVRLAPAAATLTVGLEWIL
ncbi:MAG TPA: hypothetical protein VGJ91_00040 [Polyangiaceae bacterium]|jgi:hypothetical protein